MTVYLMILSVILISLIIQKSLEKKYKNITHLLLKFLIFTLLAFSCLRHWSVGRDTISYMTLYSRIGRLEWSDLLRFSRTTHTELGYVVYNKLLSLISTNPQIVTVGNSLLLYRNLYLFLKGEREAVFSVLLFQTLGMFQDSFNICTSIIASLMVFNGIKYSKKLGKLRTISVVIAGVVVLYVLRKVRVNGSVIFLAVMMTLGMYTMYRYIHPILIIIAPDSYQGYLNYREDFSNFIMFIYHFGMILAIYIYIYRGLAIAGSPLQLHRQEVTSTIQTIIMNGAS